MGDDPPDQQDRRDRRFTSEPAIRNNTGRARSWGPLQSSSFMAIVFESGGNGQAMLDANFICQACAKAPAICSVAKARDGSPYRLCPACKDHLERRALRPREWYNLAAIHGWEQYELFDDFYDQNGIASAPETNFAVPLEPRALGLEEVEHDLDRLIGYCRTRWHLTGAEYQALEGFPRADLLARVRALAEPPNPDPINVNLALLFAANVLKRDAEDFVREQYDSQCRPLYAWAAAAATCLPRPEGLTKTTLALERLEPNPMYATMGALATFQSSDVLCWIEKQVPQKNVGERWGWLAANSQFTWGVARNWLTRGRPLSLVALDALSMFVPRMGLTSASEARTPRLADRPSTAEIRAALENYLATDDAPKAQRLCGYIVKNLEVLRMTVD